MKDNQKTLLEAARLVFDSSHQPFPNDSSFEFSEVRRGKVWCYKVRVCSTLPHWLDFPGLKQLICIEKDTWHKKKREFVRKTTSYAFTSLHLHAKGSAQLARGRWCIENYDFLVRDVILAEDACRVRSTKAFSLANLRGLCINCLRSWNLPNFTASIQRFAAKPFELLHLLGALP